MSDNHSLLAKPSGEVPVPSSALGYASSKLRMELYRLVLKALKEARISQATLARRVNKRPEQISRLLSGPGNWTIDTAAQLLFAIDGSLLKVERRSPVLERHSNHRHGRASYESGHPPTTSTATRSGNYNAQRAVTHVN